jgi:hypothetical protein
VESTSTFGFFIVSAQDEEEEEQDPDYDDITIPDEDLDEEGLKKREYRKWREAIKNKFTADNQKTDDVSSEFPREFSSDFVKSIRDLIKIAAFDMIKNVDIAARRPSSSVVIPPQPPLLLVYGPQQIIRADGLVLSRANNDNPAMKNITTKNKDFADEVFAEVDVMQQHQDFLKINFSERETVEQKTKLGSRNYVSNNEFVNRRLSTLLCEALYHCNRLSGIDKNKIVTKNKPESQLAFLALYLQKKN